MKITMPCALAAILLSGCQADNSYQTVHIEREHQSISGQEQTIIENTVTANLKDPSSAQFHIGPRVVGENIYCGTVNAKNSYGGYSGGQPFQVILILKDNVIVGASLLFMGSPGRKAETYATLKTCADHGYGNV